MEGISVDALTNMCMFIGGGINGIVGVLFFEYMLG